jgi:hypothetical protein
LCQRTWGQGAWHMTKHERERMRCRLSVAIRRRQIALDNWGKRHKYHMGAVDHYMRISNAEHMEAHVEDMRAVEDRMVRLACEIDKYQSCLARVG